MIRKKQLAALVAAVIVIGGLSGVFIVFQGNRVVAPKAEQAVAENQAAKDVRALMEEKGLDELPVAERIDRYQGIGRQLQGQERYEDAKAYYQKILILDKANEMALLGMAVCSEKTDKQDDAKKYYKQLADTMPKEGMPQVLSRAGYYAKAGEKAQAVTLYKQFYVFLTAQPDYPDKQSELDAVRNALKVLGEQV